MLSAIVWIGPMSKCKIAGCTNAALALGLCAKHYMRQRRTGDPTSAKLKPGPKPKPGGRVDALSALAREIERLRAELRQRAEERPPAAAPKHTPPGPKPKPQAEIDIENMPSRTLRAEFIKLRRENMSLQMELTRLRQQQRQRPADALGAEAVALRHEVRSLRAQ